ncbi:unnamed protein product [Mortierella alpina]
MVVSPKDPIQGARFTVAQQEAMIEWVEQPENNRMLYNHGLTKGVTNPQAYEKMADDLRKRFTIEAALHGTFNPKDMIGISVSKRWKSMIGKYSKTKPTGDGTLNSSETTASKNARELPWRDRMEAILSDKPTARPVEVRTVGFPSEISSNVHLHQAPAPPQHLLPSDEEEVDAEGNGGDDTGEEDGAEYGYGNVIDDDTTDGVAGAPAGAHEYVDLPDDDQLTPPPEPPRVVARTRSRKQIQRRNNPEPCPSNDVNDHDSADVLPSERSALAASLARMTTDKVEADRRFLDEREADRRFRERTLQLQERRESEHSEILRALMQTQAESTQSMLRMMLQSQEESKKAQQELMERMLALVAKK